MKGGGGTNNLTGNTSANDLKGAGAADTISGGDGDDSIKGAGGADNLDGGVGVDTLDYSESTAVNVNLNSNVVSGGDAAGDTITGFENVIGYDGADTITGAHGVANWLGGGFGNDSINGFSGERHDRRRRRERYADRQFRGRQSRRRLWRRTSRSTAMRRRGSWCGCGTGRAKATSRKATC